MNNKFKLFEKIYNSNEIFYHGDTDKTDELSLGNTDYEGKGLYVTSDLKYALAYTLANSEEKLSLKRKGFIYSLKLKKSIDIFNPEYEEDLEKLLSYLKLQNIELTDDNIQEIKKEDWSLILIRKPKELVTNKKLYWDKTDIIDWIKNAGFDGFHNNEDWHIWHKKNKKDTKSHSKGSGIMIFDTNNLEIIEKKTNTEILNKLNITAADVFEEEFSY